MTISIISKRSIKKFENLIINPKLNFIFNILLFISYIIVLVSYLISRENQNFINTSKSIDYIIDNYFKINSILSTKNTTSFPKCSPFGNLLINIYENYKNSNTSYDIFGFKLLSNSNLIQSHTIFNSIFNNYLSKYTYNTYFLDIKKDSYVNNTIDYSLLNDQSKIMNFNYLVIHNLKCKFKNFDDNFILFSVYVVKESEYNEYSLFNIKIIKNFSFNFIISGIVYLLLVILSFLLFRYMYEFNILPSILSLICILRTIIYILLLVIMIIYSYSYEETIGSISSSETIYNKFINTRGLTNNEFIINILLSVLFLLFPSNIFDIISYFQDYENKKYLPNQIILYINWIYASVKSGVFLSYLLFMITSIIISICFMCLFGEKENYYEFSNLLFSIKSFFNILTFTLDIYSSKSKNNIIIEVLQYIIVIILFFSMFISILLTFSSFVYIFHKTHKLELNKGNFRDNDITEIENKILSVLEMKNQSRKKEKSYDINEYLNIMILNWEKKTETLFKINEIFGDKVENINENTVIYYKKEIINSENIYQYLVKCLYYSNAKSLIYYLRILFKIKPTIQYSNYLFLSYVILFDVGKLNNSSVFIENLRIVQDFIKFYDLNIKIIFFSPFEIDTFTKLHLNKCFQYITFIKTISELNEYIRFLCDEKKMLCNDINNKVKKSFKILNSNNNFELRKK